MNAIFGCILASGSAQRQLSNDLINGLFVGQGAPDKSADTINTIKILVIFVEKEAPPMHRAKCDMRVAAQSMNMGLGRSTAGIATLRGAGQ
jgi:hypothetical protein